MQHPDEQSFSVPAGPRCHSSRLHYRYHQPRSVVGQPTSDFCRYTPKVPYAHQLRGPLLVLYVNILPPLLPLHLIPQHCRQIRGRAQRSFRLYVRHLDRFAHVHHSSLAFHLLL